MRVHRLLGPIAVALGLLITPPFAGTLSAGEGCVDCDEEDPFHCMPVTYGFNGCQVGWDPIIGYFCTPSDGICGYAVSMTGQVVVALPAMAAFAAAPASAGLVVDQDLGFVRRACDLALIGVLPGAEPSIDHLRQINI